MNGEEGAQLLEGQLELFRQRTYDQLLDCLDTSQDIEVQGRSGTRYRIEVQVFWDDEPNGNLRVLAVIDGPGWHTFKPLARDFIRRPDGTFVGE